MTSSYRTVFRAMVLAGGASLWTTLINILRTKVVAVVLGPSGFALISLYQSIGSVVSTVAGLGLTQAATREIADAVGANDEALLRRRIAVVERVALGSGLLGAVLLASLAVPLSWLTFDSGDHAAGLAVSSAALLFGAVSGANIAVLQGMRQRRRLAAAQVLGTLGGAVVSTACVLAMGLAGIPWFLVGGAAVAFIFAQHFKQQVIATGAVLSWADTMEGTRSLLRMGVAFLTSGVLGSVAAYVTRLIVVQSLGLEAAGLYAATCSLASMYVGVILAALGSDFFPRLTEVAQDRQAMNRVVNEQTEVGILLGLPGVLATIVLAPWVLRAFYSADFSAGAVIVQWQALGVALRVASWPLAFVQLAKGMPRVFMATESAYSVIQVGLLAACSRVWGLSGLGIAFALTYLVYAVGMRSVCGRLTGFAWSPRARLYGGGSVAACVVVLLSSSVVGGNVGMAAGVVISLASAALCYREMRKLLGGAPVRLLLGR